MLILAMGFFSVTAILGYNFYRKYNSRLHIHTFSKQYSRIAERRVFAGQQLVDDRHFMTVAAQVRRGRDADDAGADDGDFFHD